MIIKTIGEKDYFDLFKDDTDYFLLYKIDNTNNENIHLKYLLNSHFGIVRNKRELINIEDYDKLRSKVFKEPFKRLVIFNINLFSNSEKNKVLSCIDTIYRNSEPEEILIFNYIGDK